MSQRLEEIYKRGIEKHEAAYERAESLKVIEKPLSELTPRQRTQRKADLSRKKPREYLTEHLIF